VPRQISTQANVHPVGEANYTILTLLGQAHADCITGPYLRLYQETYLESDAVYRYGGKISVATPVVLTLSVRCDSLDDCNMEIEMAVQMA